MKHVPVLIKEVIDGLELKPGDSVVDCTLGDAGHAEEILNTIEPGRLLGIDADPEAVLRAKQYLYNFGERVEFVRDNFVNLKQIIEKNDFTPINAILFDLGWSSPQFEERRRGFSFYKASDPLDMRYSGGSELESAADLVNNWDKDDLAKIFRECGEEKLSREIAEGIVEKRKQGEIEKVSELVEIILQIYREKLNTDKEIPWIGGLHPATKVFQALRMAVNDELGVLEKVLPQAVDVLAPGGKIAVISFHSGEDRIVKHFFKGRDDVKVINKKPIIAGEEEIKSNPRARSAKLRIVEKI